MMNPIDFRPPRKPPFDPKLTLDPKIQQTMAKIDSELSSLRFRNRIQSPPWHLVHAAFQPLLNAPYSRPPGLVKPWGPLRGPFPTSKHAPGLKSADLSDYFDAFNSLEFVQKFLGKVTDSVSGAYVDYVQKPLPLSTNQHPFWEKARLVTAETIIPVTVIAPFLAYKHTRLPIIKFLAGADLDIPIPGVDGLTFKILDPDGGGSLDDAPSLTGRVSIPNAISRRYGLSVTIDLLPFLKENFDIDLHGKHKKSPTEEYF